MKGKNTPSVSVVIPAFNEEKYLQTCLTSIAKQKYKPLEIIVVDNNSTDKTKEIALSFKTKVVTAKKQGIIPTRNTGFDAAKGELIVRTDADTVVPPDWIERIVADFKNPDIVAVTGPARFGKSLNPQVTTAVFSLNKLFFNNEGLYGPNMSLRKNIWLKVRDNVCSNEADIHEDLDLSIHVSQYGKVYYDSKLVVLTSARRMKNPKSLFVDYVLKWGRTLKQHSDYFVVKNII